MQRKLENVFKLSSKTIREHFETSVFKILSVDCIHIFQVYHISKFTIFL